MLRPNFGSLNSPDRTPFCMYTSPKTDETSWTPGNHVVDIIIYHLLHNLEKSGGSPPHKHNQTHVVLSNGRLRKVISLLCRPDESEVNRP